MCEVEGKKLRVGGEQQSPPRTTPGKALYGRCVCCTRRSDRRYVMWTKSPSSLDSFPYSTERKEIQRICLHSRNARINWEDCMSVPRVRDSCCFTREVFGGGLFLFASSSFSRRDGDPHLPRRVGLVPFPRGGRAASSPENAGPDRPTLGDPRGWGAAGRGLRTQALVAARLGVRRRSGLQLGAGQDWHPGGFGGAREGGGEGRFPSKRAHQNFSFFLFFFPPFLKSKSYNL